MFDRQCRSRFDLMKPPTVGGWIDKTIAVPRSNIRGKREEQFEENEEVMVKDYSNPNHES